MKFYCFFSACIMIQTCNSQISDILFPSLTGTTRGVIDSITKQPVVTLPTRISSDILATTVNYVTKLPIAIARYLGMGSEVPFLLKSSNVVGHFDNFLTDFNLGLGNEESTMSIDQLISKYNYPVEIHEVITEDGYILKLFRIPKGGRVIFLMHGLLGSSDDFVIAGVESGLAYLLADEGYDVWMGNARGNKHSRKHVNMTPSEAKFWDFSWHEIGTYDLPASIDYILEITQERALKYIGHSQGTTVFFVMSSIRPEYNERVSLMIALSPVAFMSKVQSPIVRLFAPGTALFDVIFKSFGIYEFLPDSTVVRLLKTFVCGVGPVAEILCSNVLFLMAGFSFEQLNATNLPVIYGHVPSGASGKQFAHYGQGVLSGDFRYYHYGLENIDRYGKQVPPSYDLSNITTPVSLFYSDADWLAHPDDIDLLYSKLSNAIDIYKIPYEQFNHMDFIWAKDFKELIYKRLRKLLRYF